jgi:hypothetical protein
VPVTFSANFRNYTTIGVPEDFLSISIEMPSMITFTYSPTLIQQAALIQMLMTQKGATKGPNIRVGGNTDTSTSFADTTDASESYGYEYNIGQTSLSALAAVTSIWNGTVIMGLNMAKARDASMAVKLARASLDTFATTTLEAFEVGNEPDVYAGQIQGGALVRPSNYTSRDYDKDIAWYAAALAQAGVRANMLQQPSTCCNFNGGSWNSTWLGAFARTFATNLSAISTHFYPFTASDIEQRKQLLATRRQQRQAARVEDDGVVEEVRLRAQTGEQLVRVG